MSAPAVELRGVRVRASDGTPLLGPLDLSVEAGEHALVVGPSGAGKTTLLRTVAGLAPPHAGSVALFGRAVHEGARALVPPEGRGVGMLFQGGALWPHWDARRTLDFVLRCAGFRGDRAGRVRELLAAVELEGYEARRPATLSGGERQRLALARALAAAPRLLLLDEPLGPLDAALRGALLARLAALQEEHGFTVLHVTHDPREAAALATRTLRLERGRLPASPANPDPA